MMNNNDTGLRPYDQNNSGVHKYVFTSSPEGWFALREFVLKNRRIPTEAENELWQELRNKKLGFKFRRQHAFDFLIVDFVCIEKRLVVEVDGDIHNEPWQIEWDIQRTAYLNELGYEVIRVTNNDVKSKLDHVILYLKSILIERPSSKDNHSPSPPERGLGG